MADRLNPNDPHASHGDRGTHGWSSERDYWRETYRTRPYAERGGEFSEYEPGYRYGFESGQRHRGRDWQEVEPELRSGWDRYEHRGDNRSTWDQVKDSVRDAWHRVTGSGDSESHRNDTDMHYRTGDDSRDRTGSDSYRAGSDAPDRTSGSDRDRIR
jgi:hypothetical protein